MLTLQGMVREGFCEKGTAEQRPPGRGVVSHGDGRGTASQTQGRVSVRALRLELD